MPDIKTAADFDAALSAGKYAWPGGYPCFFLCADGETLSFEAAQENAELVRAAIANPGTDSQWEIVAVDVNWEDEDMRCAHSNAPIECAYPTDKADQGKA